MSDFRLGEILVLGLTTHSHQGELWIKFPSKTSTHEFNEQTNRWELVDLSAKESVIFPENGSVKAKFIENAETEWGGSMVKINLSGKIRWVCSFLVGNI